MQTEHRLFDDLARVATGALGTLQGAKGEFEGFIRQQMERLLADMDLVSREEFDAVKAMAAAAREENEALKARLDELSAQVAALAPKKAPARKAPAKKSEPKK